MTDGAECLTGGASKNSIDLTPSLAPNIGGRRLRQVRKLQSSLWMIGGKRRRQDWIDVERHRRSEASGCSPK